MKKVFISTALLIGIIGVAQEHFSGINTSKRVGILNANINPAELNNLSSDFEVSVFNFSTNISNNKITFNELVNGSNIEDKFFTGTDPANIRLDVLINGPSFAMKYKKWGFGLFSSANVKTNAIDVDVNLGDALTNSFVGSAAINSNYNQRLNAATWGEIGLAASRNILDSEKHRFNVGATIKFLFPGSYMNLGVSNLKGTITNTFGDINLTNATANVNISYSGSLADNYTDSSNYSKLFAGGLNGFGAEIGVNYQLKEPKTDESSSNGYKLNAGLSFRNMGTMSFKSENNVATDYNLEIQGFEALNLNQFDGSESITDIETILVNSGYLTVENTSKDFKIKLPAVINAYVDYHIHNKWYISAYTQQKLADDSENDFTTIQNVITVTPRFSGKHYEVYVPFSQNEVSDFTTGFGFRLGGFFMGSSSIITAVINDSTQADIYLGFRFGI